MAIYAFDSLGSNLKNSPRPWDRWTDVVAVVVLQTRRPVERQLVKVVQVKEYVVHEGATIVGLVVLRRKTGKCPLGSLRQEIEGNGQLKKALADRWTSIRSVPLVAINAERRKRLLND